MDTSRNDCRLAGKGSLNLSGKGLRQVHRDDEKKSKGSGEVKIDDMVFIIFFGIELLCFGIFLGLLITRRYYFYRAHKTEEEE